MPLWVLAFSVHSWMTFLKISPMARLSTSARKYKETRQKLARPPPPWRSPSLHAEHPHLKVKGPLLLFAELWQSHVSGNRVLRSGLLRLQVSIPAPSARSVLASKLRPSPQHLADLCSAVLNLLHKSDSPRSILTKDSGVSIPICSVPGKMMSTNFWISRPPNTLQTYTSFQMELEHSLVAFLGLAP